jgi:hypothetical protein
MTHSSMSQLTSFLLRLLLLYVFCLISGFHGSAHLVSGSPIPNTASTASDFYISDNETDGTSGLLNFAAFETQDDKRGSTEVVDWVEHGLRQVRGEGSHACRRTDIEGRRDGEEAITACEEAYKNKLL